MELYDTFLSQTSTEKANLLPYTLMVLVSYLNKLWTCFHVGRTLNSSVDCSSWLIYNSFHNIMRLFDG